MSFNYIYRQACAVESAARMNNHLNIFLTFSSPVGFINQTQLPMIDAILSYSNVNVRNIDNEVLPKHTT